MPYVSFSLSLSDTNIRLQFPAVLEFHRLIESGSRNHCYFGAAAGEREPKREPKGLISSWLIPFASFSLRRQKGELSNAELRTLTEELGRIRFGDNEARIKRLSVRGLLPDTEHYMTYEGSTTSPGCQETVTWIVLNKPIYITLQQVKAIHVSVSCKLCRYSSRSVLSASTVSNITMHCQPHCLSRCESRAPAQTISIPAAAFATTPLETGMKFMKNIISQLRDGKSTGNGVFANANAFGCSAND